MKRLTEKVRDFLEGEGYETFTLSTESCDFCERCAYLDGEPCRFPEHMHPCLESYGVVVSEIVEKEAYGIQSGRKYHSLVFHGADPQIKDKKQIQRDT